MLLNKQLSSKLAFTDCSLVDHLSGPKCEAEPSPELCSIIEEKFALKQMLREKYTIIEGNLQ